MIDKQCNICFDAEANTSITYDNESIEVCEACKIKFEAGEEYDKIFPIIKNLFGVLAYSKHDYQKDAFVKVISRQNRTEQQQFFEWIVALINYYGSLQFGYYDLRNQDTVETCKELAKVLENKTFRRI